MKRMFLRGAMCAAPECSTVARCNCALGPACTKHYQRVVKHGSWAGRVYEERGCSHPEGCERKHYAHGFCNLHYQRTKDNDGDPGPLNPKGRSEWYSQQRICFQCHKDFTATNYHQGRCVDCQKDPKCCTCGGPSKWTNYECNGCRRATDKDCLAGCGRKVTVASVSGYCGHCNRRGLTSGRYTSKTGYVHLSQQKSHPNATKGGTILEHVYVMAEFLGRPLVKPETVHHKNGQRDDNRIENLELWSKNHGAGQRVSDKIRWMNEFLTFYGNDPTKYETGDTVEAHG